MKLRQGLKFREVCGEKVVVSEDPCINFNKLLHLNESAAYLWEEFYGKEFEQSDLASTLVDRYGIDLEVAVRDSGNLVESWKEAGVIAGFSPSTDAPVQEKDASAEVASHEEAQTGGKKDKGFLVRLLSRFRAPEPR